MNVKVSYFAALRDQSGIKEESIETDQKSVGELYLDRLNCHGFDLPAKTIQFSVNAKFVDFNWQLSEGDHVVFIPPVAGG